TADSDTLAAAHAGLEQARHKRTAARSLYMPEIALSANYMYLDDDITLSPDDILSSMPAGSQLQPLIEGLGQQYGLSGAAINSAFTSTIAEQNNRSISIGGSWPIYTGGRIDAAQDIAANRENEAGQKLRKTRHEQFELLVRYYFGAVLAQQVFTTLLEVEKGLQAHFEHAQLLEQQGQIARVEKLQAEAAYDKARVDRRKAGHDLEIAGTALARTLKIQPRITPTDNLFISNNLPETAFFLDKTLESFPGLGLLESKQKQAEDLVIMEKGRYYPTVALVGNYNIYEEDNLAGELLPEWIVGVGLKLPLMERSGRSGDVAAAKSMVKQLEFLQNQARNDLAVMVEKTYRQTEQAKEEYHGLRSSLELAEETVLLRTKAFNQGLSTSLDVVDAELFLAEVKTRRSAAVYNHVIALAKLLALSDKIDAFFQYQNPLITEVQ
ncbi:MAG: TolC family protein, partial [Desulfopila sp.]|nr:TolC family protein [Desulfopila sp.]